MLALMLSLSLTFTSVAADASPNESMTKQQETEESDTPANPTEENLTGEEDSQETDNSDLSEADSVEQKKSDASKKEESLTTQSVQEEETEGTENTAEDATDDTKAVEASDKWTTEDFTYTTLTYTLNGCDYTRQFQISGPAIAGFSESGEKKLETNKNLVIPSVNDQGEKLVGVAQGAFKEKGLESVKFPEGMLVDYDDTVTHTVTRRGNFIIDTEAFAKNNLTSVTLPSGVIAVMPSAFKNNQLTRVSLPHTIWWIENSSFAYNELATVGFPKTCDFQLQIHAFAFAHNNIKSVRLPDYVEVVEKKVFYWNPGMEDCPAEAPENEQGFGGVVYMYTDNADLVGMDRIHHIEKTAESQKSWHQKLIVGSAPAEEGDWTLQDFTVEGTTVTGLSESGIEKRKSNKNLVLPDKNAEGEYITEIGSTTESYGLFATEEEKFESVELPAKLEKIGTRAFVENGLTKVTFPSTLKEIGVAAFQTNQLESVILPDSVTTLGGGAFATNPKLSTLILSKNLTEIPSGAFGCSDANNYMENLTEVKIPEGVTKIGANAFAGNNIKNIEIPSNVTEIGNYAFSTKNYLKDECTVTLPEGLTTIGSYAFRNKVIKEVNLPTTVTGLKKNTFQKEYSDSTVATVTKVYVTKAQYLDKKNFPDSDYHTYALKADPNDTEWDAYDFTYATWEEAGLSESEVTMHPASDTSKKVTLNPYLVTGLSEIGEQKLEKNPNLIIPKTDPDGKKVTGIGPKAFYQKTQVESVTFPEGVMAEYDGPEGVIADGVTERGDFVICKQAFDGCTALTDAAIPEGVIRIGMYAFRSTKLTSVDFPHTVWWIETAAYAKSEISSITFEECDFYLNLLQQAFMANQIKAVQLPKRTEYLHRYTFMQNPGMEPIDAEAPSTWGGSKGFGVVHLYADAEVANQALVHHYDTAGSNKSYAQKLITDEAMPETLKPWNADDFTYSEDGTTITGLSESGTAKRAESSVMTMPNESADGTTITAIGAAQGVDSHGLFGAENEPIQKVVLPKNVKEIGQFAFRDCGLTEIHFPGTLESIGTSAFMMNQLTEVILPDSVTTVGGGAFASNFTLETVKISKGMTEIPASFVGCSGISVAENFTEIEIPEGITSIGSNAFAGNCFTSVEIPGSVKSIGSNAFSQAQAHRTLKEVILHEGLESIGSAAFQQAPLQSVELPSTVTTLNKNAFRYCTDSGEKVKLYTSNTEQLEDTKTFIAESDYHKTVYNNLVGTGWSYSDFTFEGGVLTGWSEQGNQTRLDEKKLVLPQVNPETDEAVTAIGDGAFKIPDDEITQLKDSVESPNGMTEIEIPSTVTKIGEKAFEYNSLTRVALPEKLEEIGVSAFHGNRLENIEIPDSVTSMGGGAFSENNITAITLSKGLTKLEQGVFSMNIRLEHVEIPDNITEIGDMAFAGARLTSLEIPKSVTKIGRKAFHLHHLTELTIPGNVKEIGDSAFEGTPKAITLEKLVLEEGIETIGSFAFKEGYLESVKLPKSLKSLAADAFSDNAGTNNDHVVVCYTSNAEHLKFSESTSHKIVYEKESTNVTRKPVKVKKIKVTGISKKIAAGKKVRLKAAVSPSNADNKAVTWKSSNKKVATVNSKGVVTMKKKSGGKTVKIYAVAKDGSGVKATYKIRSMKGVVKKVKISCAKSVKAGKSLKLKAKVKTNGKKANKKLAWTSSNTKYAKVTSSGKVKTYKAGKGKTVKITAKATDGSNKKKTVKIKIK